MNPLTDKQQEILDYMQDFHAEEDRLPSSWELTRHFGWKSQNSAMQVLLALIKKGYLEHRQDPEKGEKGWYRFNRK